MRYKIVFQFFRLAWNVLHVNLPSLLPREKNSYAKRTGISFFNRISGRAGIWLARNFVRASLRFPYAAIGVHKMLAIVRFVARLSGCCGERVQVRRCSEL